MVSANTDLNETINLAFNPNLVNSLAIKCQ